MRKVRKVIDWEKDRRGGRKCRVLIGEMREEVGHRRGRKDVRVDRCGRV